MFFKTKANATAHSLQKMTRTSEEQKQKPLPCCCISHQFLKAASKSPHKIAAVHPPPASRRDRARAPAQSINGPDSITAGHSPPPAHHRDQCFTFEDILNSVDSLAYRLRRSIPHHADDPHLIKPNSREAEYSYKPKVVGIYMPPSVEYIVSALSVLRCGEAFLPLDPSWPKERVISTISSSNADLVITSRAAFVRGGYDEGWEWIAECGCCLVLWFEEMHGGGRDVEPLHFGWPCEKEEKRLFCYLMYTSGSTGVPKGVCGTEQGLLNRFLWMEELYPLHGVEVLLFKTSISFVDHLQEFLGAMLTASTLVIPPFRELKENPLSIIYFLEAYSVNRVIAVPSLMSAILPSIQSQYIMRIRSSLKLLILSGEVFPLSLWEALSNLLPTTSILNLYGSTEVSGDCTYFDCKRLPSILDTQPITSVPIGVPISNCDVLLIGDTETPNQGEIYVGGLCVSCGYFSESAVVSSDFVEGHKNFKSNCSKDYCGSHVYYRSGDFAQRLPCGDLVFLGRKDRIVKVNGQRVSLEEIEGILRGHPCVLDAAVISHGGPGELSLLIAFLLLKEKDKSDDFVKSSIRSWMVEKVPLAMIPSRILLIESFPMSTSGKVDYTLLASSAFSNPDVPGEVGSMETTDLLEVIKKAFCDALMVDEVSGDDDFFMMGGNSIFAAHASYNLGIDMRLLYSFPTPSKLHTVLMDKRESSTMCHRSDANGVVNHKADDSNVSNSDGSPATNLNLKSLTGLSKKPHQKNDDLGIAYKHLKVDVDQYVSSKCVSLSDSCPWSSLIPKSCAFSRCNKVTCEARFEVSNECQAIQLDVSGKGKISFMQELWKVHMDSCVDASPLVVFKDHNVYLFIGSHSHKFICIDAKSGVVQWEAKLEGRVECSAAIVGDFSQVVVGCYKGKIYFLDFFSGNVCWTFQTGGEVKSQPVVDIHRKLVWCGSHDHNLYAFDYRNHYCVHKFPCGGSIFGSPSIDEVHDTLYVASTSGHLTAISLKAFPFCILWQRELEVPVFGSPSVSIQSAYVICCLVDGSIIMLDNSGSIIWRRRTGGPVFAGACTAHTLPSQVLICSRDGIIYSFEMERGDLLWKYDVGDPIVASAYVDEHLQLVSDPCHLLSDRVICVCTSSGIMILLRTNMDVVGKTNEPSGDVVQELARFKLPGEIFSSPVMIGGRIFVGCRDDYVHCIAVKTKDLVGE